MKHASDIARETAERDARRREVVMRLLHNVNQEPVLSMLKELPASERIEALGEAIGQCAARLIERRGLSSRDSAVHSMTYLARLLSEETR